MIETNTGTVEFSWVAKGREFLQQGDVSAAVECYGSAFDPDSVDEVEARSMLIEARSSLSRKHLLEALESFEEALLMGTELQRRQALEGIAAIGAIKSRLVGLTEQLNRGLKSIVGRKRLASIGLAVVADDENTVFISNDAVRALSGRMAVGKRLSRIPHHFADHELPIECDRCIPYADEDDVRFILAVAKELTSIQHAPKDD